MRIQDETDCHLSRLSRSLMTRTAFGRVLTPAVQAPGIETPGFIISFFFRVPPLPRVPVCTAPTYTRAPLSLSSSLHRFAAIIVFPASFSTVLVPSRRLNSIC